MSDEPKDKQVIPIDDHYDDGFSDLEPSERTIQGSFLKFTQEGKWTEVGITVPPGLKLLAVETASILQRWKDQKVVDEITEKPFPDIDTLNEAIPERRMGDRISTGNHAHRTSTRQFSICSIRQRWRNSRLRHARSAAASRSRS